jgi:hypothetical protein
MNHTDHLSGWPVVLTWAANVALWFAGGMSPLQAFSILIAIGYTIHRWVLLKRGKSLE